jgi:hypothetical protein
MGYECEEWRLDSGVPGYPHDLAMEELDGVEKLQLAARASDNRLARQTRHPSEMRVFLVACHQASVSIATMSRFLGLDVDFIRTELLLGIAAWNAARRRTGDAAFRPGRGLTASWD